MAASAKFTIDTNHTQNNTDTPFKNNFDKEECGDIFDDQDKGGEILDNLSTSDPAKVTIGAKHT